MSTSNPQRLFNPELHGKRLLAVMSAAIAVIIIDSEIGYIADFISDAITSPPGIALFIALAVAFAFTQYLILAHLRVVTEKVRAKFLYLTFMHKAVTVAQYALVAVTGVVILQIMSLSQYDTFSVYINLVLSYGIWIIMMGLLARAFLSWYGTASSLTARRGIPLVLIFALAMIAYVMNGIFLLTNYLAMLMQQPSTILSTDVAFFPEFEPDSIVSQLNTITQIPSSIAYILTWIGTVMLLRPYITKFGRAKFWVIMSFALVYYLISFPLYALGYFSPAGESDTDVMNFILLTSMSSLLAGIILGAAFLSIARTLDKGNPVRQHLIIAAYGMLIFYLAGSSMVTQTAYPPFGFVSVAFTGLSTFMIYAGLYSSAVAISQDSILRQTIMKSAKEQSRLLDSIGTAQMEKELETLASDVSKKAAEMKKESGVEPSMTDDDIRDYLESVMKEIKQTRGSADS